MRRRDTMRLICGAAMLVCAGVVCTACDKETRNEDPDPNTPSGCTTDAVCSDPSASRCDVPNKSCVPCSEDSHCAHLTGTGVCDNGTCVQCAAGKEAACGGNVCDLTAKQCTDHAEKSADLCQPCANDRQCKDGRVCVMTTFKDPATADAPAVEVGRFCLWNKDAASADDGKTANQCPRPYFGVSENVSTANGATATVCSLRVTTCTALTDYSMKMCSASAQPPQPDDAMCGVANQPDGFCVQVPADSSYRCTVPCGSNDDCFTGFDCTASKRCKL